MPIATTRACWWLALLSVIIIQLCAPALASKSAPDIAICPVVLNGTSAFIDCLSGSKNFCCDDSLVENERKLRVWSKKCCSEAEFVAQNSNLYGLLIFMTISMVNVMIVVVLSSLSSIILTKKAALD